MLPRWFMKVNRHGTPARAMAFNAAASIVCSSSAPVRIYVFSNMGYLPSIAVALFGYFCTATTTRNCRGRCVCRRAKWVALAIAVIFAFIWAYGGWHSPALVVGRQRAAVLPGLAILLAYLPLYWWRADSDRRLGLTRTVRVRSTALRSRHGSRGRA